MSHTLFVTKMTDRVYPNWRTANSKDIKVSVLTTWSLSQQGA